MEDLLGLKLPAICGQLAILSVFNKAENRALRLTARASKRSAAPAYILGKRKRFLESK
jgi:hypothetical protein